MPIPVADLVQLAVQIFDIPAEDITGRSRVPEIYVARAAVSLAARKSGRGYRAIARALGDRDHKAIVHACKRAEQMAEGDREYRAACDYLVAKARAWAAAHTQELLSHHLVRAIKAETRSAA